jgi:hypothetical protein
MSTPNPAAALCGVLAKAGHYVPVRAMEAALLEAGMILTGGTRTLADAHLARVAELSADAG